MSTIPNLNTAPGNTPLTAEELEQLIPNLSTKQELDEFEFTNIISAHTWAFNKRVLKRYDPLTEPYLRELHRRMFDGTWKWAGRYRNSEKNRGCDPHDIRNRIPVLLGNARHWFEHSVYSIDESAIRFHHQLVGEIHPFPNGNGRHARLMADVLAMKHGRPQFNWGSQSLVAANETRFAYIAALQAADAGNIQPLLTFARS
jgi:Fic-DOC domain mobile mystery protein B